MCRPGNDSLNPLGTQRVGHMLGLGVSLLGALGIGRAIADVTTLGECVTDQNLLHE